MKRVAFLSNFYKTEFFYEVASSIKNHDIKIYWVAISKVWYEWLIKKGVDRNDILLINSSKSVLEYNDLEISDNVKNMLNAIVLMDRKLPCMKDSRLIAESMYKQVYNFFFQKNIGMVFGEQTWAYEILSGIAVTELGGVSLRPHTTRIPDGRFCFFKGFDESDILIQNKCELAKSDKNLAAEVSAFLDDYSRNKTAPRYIKFNSSVNARSFPSLSSIFRAVGYKFRDNDNYTRFTVRELLKTRFSTFLNKKIIGLAGLFDDVNYNDDYILVTLHKQPEHSIDVLGYRFNNQVENIKLIARIAGDRKIYVKEHINSIGDRTLSWYKDLKKIPNVKLIAPEEDSFKLILNASLVVSVSGTACYEAAILGKKAFCFSKMFFDDLLVSKSDDFFDPLKYEAFSSNAEKDIKKFLAELYTKSFPGIISDPKSDSTCISKANVENVSAAFVYAIEYLNKTA